MEDKFLDPIINTLDTAKLGLLEWRKFMASVRGGAMSDARGAVVASVFLGMSKDGGATVSADDLAYYFNGKAHPLCQVADLSVQDALAHMMMSCSVRGQMPTSLTLEQFSEYYNDLSAAVDDDAYFEDVVRGSFPQD